MMATLRNSPEAATQRFKLQLAILDDTTSSTGSTGSISSISSSSTSSPCEASEGVRFVTAASGPLPAPWSSSSPPTTELLLQGHRARCVRFVAMDAFSGIGLGLEKIALFEAVDRTAVAAEAAATLERRRRLVQTPTSATCGSCPTFGYGGEESSIGGIISFFLVSMFVIGFLICLCLKQKREEQRRVEATQQAYPQGAPLQARMAQVAGPNPQQAAHAAAVASTGMGVGPAVATSISVSSAKVVPAPQPAVLQAQAQAPQTIVTVTVPHGVLPGQVIQVQAPNGTLVAVPVPMGVSAGMQFRVDMRSVMAPQVPVQAFAAFT